MLQSILFIYVCVLLWALLFSNRLIFRPPPPTYTADTFELLTLNAANGDQIAACHLPLPAARYTLLLAHGNGEDLGNVVPFGKELRKLGVAVMMFDYPGYGLSTGPSTERGAYRAIDAAYDYLVNELGTPPERIILHGRSLGAAVAIDLAARQPVAGVIAESAFVTAFRVMTRVRMMPFDKFNSLSKVRRMKCPLLSIHGRLDPIVRFWHGERLYAAALPPKQHLWVDDASHNDLVWVAGAAYARAIRAFIESLSPPGHSFTAPLSQRERN